MGSLAVGATYGQSGNTVTVTLASHGVTANRNGYRFYWPGSAAVPAGWYGGLAYIDANSFAFQNPAPQTVAPGAAITGTLPYTLEVKVCSATVKGGALGAFGRLVIEAARSGDINANNKIFRPKFGGQQIASSSLSTTPAQESRYTVWNAGSELINFAVPKIDGTADTASTKFAIDTAVDQQVELFVQLSNGQGWIAVDYADFKIITRRSL